MSDKNILSTEDQARVDGYLNKPNHQVERRSFRPWLLMGVIVLVMTFLSLFSYMLAFVNDVI
jgi:hypothetical protein